MVRNANKKHREKLTFLEKLALKITSAVGTMYCAIIFTLIALISLPEAIQGDTATTISWIAQTFLQLVLLSIIMVEQNLQSKHSELRKDADYETNVEVKKCIEEVDRKLDEVLLRFKSKYYSNMLFSTFVKCKNINMYASY